MKENLTRQYETRIKELEKLTSKAPSPRKARKARHASTPAEDPVGALVDQVLDRASGPQLARTTLQAMDPVRQVAPKSYIGQALG